MNFAQKLGVFILVAITVIYIYLSFFQQGYEKPTNNEKLTSEYNPMFSSKDVNKDESEKKDLATKDMKIFVLDDSGKLRAVKRTCDPKLESSCFEFVIKELITAPSKWEKSKGFTSEIPSGTKLLSVRESSDNIKIDLSSNFESGGGAESIYLRVKQIIKTVNANTSLPTFLYINGKQANVIGGEGIMIKQPLSERSFDE